MHRAFVQHAQNLRWKTEIEQNRTLERVIDVDERKTLNCTLDKHEVWRGLKLSEIGSVTIYKKRGIFLPVKSISARWQVINNTHINRKSRFYVGGWAIL
jgi:hypothetical protein